MHSANVPATLVEQPLAQSPTPTPAPVPSVELLIQHAITHQTPVEALERLLAMRERIKAEQAREAFFVARAAFQAECPVIQKVNPVQIDGKVRYYFAPLEAIVKQVRDLLQKHGFSYSFDCEDSETKLTAICHAMHAAGHVESSRFSIPWTTKAAMSDQQKFGAALTFAKRYAFCSVFGIIVGDEDDDCRAKAPNPKPETDPEAPHAPTREERKTFNLDSAFRELVAAYKAKHGGDKAAFVKWAQDTLTSSEDFGVLANWNERDITICLEALQ